VSNIESGVVKALKSLAGKHGISAEEQHRKILKTSLLKPKKVSFTEVLEKIPKVGKDSDFERFQDSKADNVFD
jgi:antitoxin FitA